MGPRVDCPQNLVRAHKKISRKLNLALKKLEGPQFFMQGPKWPLKFRAYFNPCHLPVIVLYLIEYYRTVFPFKFCRRLPDFQGK